MDNCMEYHELFEYAVGELEGFESAVAEVHLKHCDSCRVVYREIKRLTRALSNLPRRRLSQAAWKELMAKARGEMPMEPVERAERVEAASRRRAAKRIPAPMALAASALVAFTVLNAEPAALPANPSSLHVEMEKALAQSSCLTPVAGHRIMLALPAPPQQSGNS